MISFILALLAIIGGVLALGAFVLSVVGTPLQRVQRADILLIAVALFAFAGALGIWHFDSLVSDYLDDQRKK